MAGRNCVTFIWKIPYLFRTDDIVNSPEFYVNSLRESGWMLRFNIPSLMSKEVTIRLYNKYYKEGPGSLCVDCEISILAVNPSKTISHFRENIIFLQNHYLEVDGFPSWYTLAQKDKDEYFLDDTLTIQCKLWKKNVKSKKLTPLFYQAYSRYPIRRISMDWSLNFDALKEGNKIQTTRFSLDKKQPIFDVETFIVPRNRMGFKIKQQNSDFNQLKLSCKISVLDAEGNVSIWKEWFTKLNTGVSFNFPSFIKINSIKENCEKYIKSNELVLVFDFTFEIDNDDSKSYNVIESISIYPPETKSFTQHQSTPSIQTLSSLQNLFCSTSNLFAPEKKTSTDACTSTDNESDLITQTLKDDLHDMYLINSWSDVVLEAEGRTFPCHKCILSARSPVFHSLLSESTTYTLRLELKASVLGSMLQFIYTGDIGVSMDFQNATELYEAATNYKIISLKNVCSKFLEDNMTEQNACDLLVLASKLGDATLKTRTEDFILKRPENILASDKWKDLVKRDAKYIVETMHRMYLGKERGDSSSLLLKPQEVTAISEDIEKSTVEHNLNFLSIYQSSLFSDFELCSKSGKAFGVHKNILWARSPVFKAMLSTSTEESSVTTLDVPEMDEQTMEQFLSFVYSGKLQTEEIEVLSKLYFSADKYQILSLKEWCSKSLVRGLSVNNVCEILVMSDQYKDEKIKNEVLDFLAKNDESVILSPEWKNIMKSNPQLVSETVYQIYTRKTNLNRINSEKESEKILHSGSTQQSSSEIDAATILQIDLVSLYEAKYFSDCKLCTSDKTFEVHKNILCGRSPLFNAMFSSDLEEATTNTLVIPDIDGQTVDQMLRFIYTGACNLEDTESTDLCKLYYAADKYQINSLKDWCSHLLKEKISVENVCEILLLANRHGDASLETAIYNFLIRNSKEVFNSDVWKAFMSIEPYVSCETMLAIY